MNIIKWLSVKPVCDSVLTLNETTILFLKCSRKNDENKYILAMCNNTIKVKLFVISMFWTGYCTMKTCIPGVCPFLYSVSIPLLCNFLSVFSHRY